MKLQPDSKRELKHIAIGESIGAAVVLLAFFVLKKADLSVILGILLGSVVAVLNFLFLCLSVQKASAQEDFDAVKRIMHMSYTRRMLLTVLTIAIGITVNAFHWVAVVIQLLMPRVVIMAMQLIGLYQPESSTKGG